MAYAIVPLWSEGGKPSEGAACKEKEIMHDLERCLTKSEVCSGLRHRNTLVGRRGTVRGCSMLRGRYQVHHRRRKKLHTGSETHQGRCAEGHHEEMHLCFEQLGEDVGKREWQQPRFLATSSINAMHLPNTALHACGSPTVMVGG